MLRDALRSARRQRLTDPHSWVGRIVVWTAAIVVGLLIAGFAELSSLAFAWFEHLRLRWGWLPLLITPLVGMLAMWLTRRFFPGAEGGGIPQVIAATDERLADAGVRRFISLRIALGKIGLVALALAGGFSAGREGPSVQIGAGLMHAARRFLPAKFEFDPRSLIIAGGAAGMAATFNTPLAGIVFAIEQLMRRFDERTNGVLIAAIIWAGLVPMALLGNYTYFGRVIVSEVTLAIGAVALGAGLVCGIAGGFFARIVIAGVAWIPPAVRVQTRHPVVFAGACGLGVAVIGVASGGATFGGGYEATRAILDGSFAAPWYYTAGRYASSLLTALAGIPAGIFAPSLAIGAGIGHDLAPLAPEGVAAAAVVALCMAAFLAAVTDAPLTSFVVVMEMIDGHALVLSLMVATVTARLVARLITPPLYETIAARLRAQAAPAGSQDGDPSPPERKEGDAR
jgi:H+/Cl- antiporter ClcA